MYFYIGSGVSIAAGLILPGILKPVHLFLASLLVIVRVVLTYVVLLIAFYFIFTPIGLCMRLLGKDMLHERIDPNAKSYWIIRTKKEYKPEDYERQF